MGDVTIAGHVQTEMVHGYVQLRVPNIKDEKTADKIARLAEQHLKLLPNETRISENSTGQYAVRVMAYRDQPEQEREFTDKINHLLATSSPGKKRRSLDSETGIEMQSLQPQDPNVKPKKPNKT